MKKLRPFMLLAGRVCLVLALLAMAGQKLVFPEGSAYYMDQKGMPGASKALAYVLGVLELIAGVAILVGWRTRTIALAVAVYLLPVTWYTHVADAWRAADAVVRDQEMTQALKSLSLVGGLLILAVSGPGEYSLDRK